jgi:hypothetical protein
MSRLAKASVFVLHEVFISVCFPESTSAFDFGMVETLLKNSGFPLLMRDHSAKAPGRNLSDVSRDATLSERFLLSDCAETELCFGVAGRLPIDCPLKAMGVV